MNERRGFVSILGPEGTPLSFPLASPIARIAAFSVDCGILLCVLLALLFGLVFGLSVTGSWLAAVALVLVFALRHGYFLFFETVFQGATPGKKLLGLRVISHDGGRLRLEAVVARNLMRDLELFVPIVVLASPSSVIGEAPGWLSLASVAWVLVIGAMPLYTRERTRTGDLVGGTVVVEIPRAILYADETRAAAAALVFDRAQLAVYGEYELETLAQLLRSHEKQPMNDEDLVLVATTIAARIGFEGSEPRSAPLVFLREFYRSQRAELENKLVLGRRKANKHES